jgi:RNA polymerase sigma factor (sigma-70 family)
MDAPGALARNVADHGPDFRTAVEDRELLDTAFERLPADQRTLLALHYGMGFSIGEVATVLEVPIGTAKSRLNAALTAMRQAAAPPEQLARRGAET